MDMHHLNLTKSRFNEMANTQERKGILKYGQPLDPLEDRDWLIMAQEEQTDGYKYLIAEQEKRKFIVDKIKKLIRNHEGDHTDIEIGHWLDVLIGANG